MLRHKIESPTSFHVHRLMIARCDGALRLDVSALGFWCPDQRALFDIRVFDPVAPSNAHQSLESAPSKQDNEKRRQYEDRILHVDHASFTLLVFTIAGGINKFSKKILQKIRGKAGRKRDYNQKAL